MAFEMKKIGFWTLAAGLLVAGCGRKSEAEKLGYRGADVSDVQSYYTVDGVTTNWVPMRLFEVVEDYAISTNEAALVAALDMAFPGAKLKELPAGYAADEEGAWLTAWKKPAEHFGAKGAKGFYSHYDEESGVHETGEAYFSSYWKTREEALAAAADLKEKISAAFGPLKVHALADGWIAEYLRLRVMCVAGTKPDGTWCCMLTLADKANAGCGPWESAEAQRERKAEYLYERALRAWDAAVRDVREKNRAACAEALKAKGLPGLEGASWSACEDGSHVFVQTGFYDGTNTVDGLWREKGALLKKAYGLELPEKAEAQEVGGGFCIFFGAATNDTPYEARVDIAAPPESAAPEAGADEAPRGQWRLIVREKLLPGHALPQRPERGR